MRKLGKPLNAFSAQDDAVSKRPANRWATAIPACIRYISGSRGLRRIARSKCLMAPSGWPLHALRKPPRNQAAARFEFEHQRPIEQGDAAIEITGEMAERMAASREGDRIVLAQLHGPPGQSNPLRDFSRVIRHPSIDFAPEMTPRRHPVGRRVLRIELNCLVEQRQRLVDGLPGSLVQVRHPAQIVVVGIEAFGGLALCAFDLRPLQLSRDRTDHARGHLILQLEDVVYGAIETVGRDMRPSRRVDQLRGDAYPARCFAQAAFQHIAHAQLAAHLPHVHSTALVGKARVARDDEEPANVRQRCDDILHNSIGEIILLGVSAQVHEWQHRNRGLVGKRQHMCRCLVRADRLNVRGVVVSR